jgi:quinol monooxygenase YgiN
MIRHIVLFNAKRREDLPEILAGLSLLQQIPHVSKLEVVLNGKMDQLGNEVDVVVYGEFENRAAFDLYKAHPLYQESIRRVRPLRDMRIAVDYHIPG